MKKKAGAGKRRMRWWWILVPAAAVLLVLLAVLWRAQGTAGSTGTGARLSALETEKSGPRPVGEAEYAFYRGYLARDGEAADSQVQQQIARQDAEFRIARALGIHAPASFSELQGDLERENAARAAKKENGEPVYGLEKFDLGAYYDYVESTTRTKVIQAIAEDPPGALLQSAKNDYQKDPSGYRTVESVDFTVQQDGKTTRKNLQYQDLRGLQKTDDALLQFLMNAEENETMEDTHDGKKRVVTFLSAQTRQPAFEEVQTTVLKDFIGKRYLDQLVETVAANHPVTLPVGRDS